MGGAGGLADAKATEDVAGHRRREHVMAVESDAVLGLAPGRGLADVVQHRAPRQRGIARRHGVQDHGDMGQHVALRVVFGRLRHAIHGGDLGQQIGRAS